MKKLVFLAFQLILASASLVAQNQEGVASYYNDKYHNARTYSGERYDKNALTCAHKTFPMGTLLKVTAIDNEKSVVVRVNDRMSSASKVIDLSKAAASKLDIVRKGTAKVRLEVVEKEAENPEAAVAGKTDVPPATTVTPDNKPVKTEATAPADKAATATKPEPKANPVTSPEPVATPVAFKASDYEPFDLLEISLKKPEKQGYGVQIAVLTSEEALFKKLSELEDDWFSSVLVSVQKGENGEKLYKLILGAFPTQEAANSYKTNLKKNKMVNGFVVELSKLDGGK